MSFDLVRTPLDQGVTRLEASAGTGKTFALAGLFLRLLLEEKVPAREILVVTFTEAATAELRDRIRKRLSQALAVFEGKGSHDALLMALAQRVAARRNAAVLLVRNALELFDLVSIYTIHSFCQRTLQDSTFESGALFDVELVSDQEALIRETAADYCRRQLHGCDEWLASASMRAQLNPEALSRMLKQFLTYAELQLVTATPPQAIETILEELRATFGRCAEAWKQAGGREGLVNYFVGVRGKKWAVKTHAKRDVLDDSARHMEACFDEATLTPEIWEAVEFFSTSQVRAETGKGKEMPQPQPRLFELCERLGVLIDEYSTAHRLAFLQGAGQMLAQRKQEAKQQSFDDLVSRLSGALDGASGAALAQSVRRKYQAALIDESQDTDPLQWKIFERVFAQSSKHWLYLIGDPKQAIYGFRGADVKTYLRAAATAAHEFSLDTNWRSESALVHAVNAVFSKVGKTRAFLEEKILFETAKPGPEADRHPLLWPPDDRRPPPFQVWCWESAKGAVTSKEARKQLPVAVAGEISRLLNLGVLLGERGKVRPGDMAILVESHKQAGWMQRALHELNIPSVEQAMESVFESKEARELQWILGAILAPGRESSIKSALTTDALGLNGTQLHALVADEDRWQARLQAFARYREIWEKEGFFYMFAQLLREEEVMENLLRFPDAERRITNLLHVAELLEAASRSKQLGTSRLALWLEERRTSHEAAPEAFQLRLESDADAVQIITIHRAKGLEYPIVFCPFVSKDAKPRQIKAGGRKVSDVVLYHDAATGILTWDLSREPEEAHARLSGREQLAEKVRLLYVALTRARNRCYLVSAPYARKKSTALAWLMHRSNEVPNDPVTELENEETGPGAWKSRWQEIAGASAEMPGGKPGIAVADLPVEPAERWARETMASVKMEARSCERKIERSWFLSSFTQLASQVTFRQAGGEEGAAPDPDESLRGLEPTDLGGEESNAATGIFALPASARTGDCLHKIIEGFDFAAADEDEAASLVRRQLEAFNLWHPSHAAAIAEMLDRLRHAPLDPSEPKLILRRVPPAQRLTEMEFQFPTTDLDANELLGLIRNARASDMPRGAPAAVLPVSQIRVFLKGFIDLVLLFEGRYHIIDWKSNLLGRKTEDYSPEAMKTQIVEHCYDLQYHIYTVALDKFLRQRLAGYDYDRDFGGVHYVFLRGLDAVRPDLGVFHDRPSREVIERLSAALGSFAEVAS